MIAFVALLSTKHHCEGRIMDGSWFSQALERVGASQADLARHLRLAPSAVSRMLKGERQMKPLEVVNIAAFLRVPEDEVLRHAVGDTSDTQEANAPRPGRGRPRLGNSATPAAQPSRLPHEPDRIPIRSGARGGTDQEMFLEDGPIGYTSRPANLGGVRSAYAIYMVGDSMEPRYEPGWLLHVNPFKPPTRGRDVVVYKQGQSVLIKQFVGWEGDTLVLRQLNPPETLRIRRDQVRDCHLVVGTDQEG
jgi:phage repressor protein C with HTH and peptisase S24 domain